MEVNKQEIEKAIEGMKKLYDYNVYGISNKDVRIAISALQQQLTGGWIPVSSGRLPEEEGRYIVTLDNGEVGYLLYKNNQWMVNNVIQLCPGYNVTAWMPRPEPWKEKHP